MTATLIKTKCAKKPPAKQAHPRPPDTPADIRIDWSSRAAFLALPLEERQRRTEAWRAEMAPAFANYSSDDFRADQRREAGRG
jgi:hypothetical protein